jgi:hypothetical protein
VASAVASRGDFRLHVAVVLPAQAVGCCADAMCRRPALRVARSRGRRPSRPSRSQTLLPKASSASSCPLPRSSSATRCSGPRSAPGPSTSPGCHPRPPGRSCSVDGWVARRLLSSRSPRRLPSRRWSPAARRAPAPRSSPQQWAAWPTSPSSSPSAASLAAPRCGRWRSSSSSSACWVQRSPASPSCRPRGKSRAIFVGLLDDPPNRLHRSGIPEGTDAVVRLLVVTAVVLVIANWRMRRLRLSGAAD